MSYNNDSKYVLPSNKTSTSLLIHILLSVFLGIFRLLPWVYKTTKLLNKVKGGDDRNPSSTLIMFAIIPLYSVYWFMKTAQIVELACKRQVEVY